MQSVLAGKAAERTFANCFTICAELEVSVVVCRVCLCVHRLKASLHKAESPCRLIAEVWLAVGSPFVSAKEALARVLRSVRAETGSFMQL